MKYTVRAALHEETKEGWVWIYPPQNPPSIHIRIRNLVTGRRVVCEQREIDKNFRWFYNARELTQSLPHDGNVIVISGYYRDWLDLPLDGDETMDLDISPVSGPLAGLLAGLSHPNSAVRTGTWLGILSAVLGVLSFGLAMVVLLPRL